MIGPGSVDAGPNVLGQGMAGTICHMGPAQGRKQARCHKTASTGAFLHGIWLRVHNQRLLPWAPKPGSPKVAECLLNYLDEVVHFRPAWSEKHAGIAPSTLARLGNSHAVGRTPALVMHYTGLKERKPRMRQRLRAAGLEMQTFFVEMMPHLQNSGD